MNLHGHFWTFAPHVRHVFKPPAPPPSRHWRTTLRDQVVGDVALRGRLHPGRAGNDELLVVVHGLGGSHRSSYAVLAAQAAHHLGMASLRINLRGADRYGEDYYHAGLSQDLEAVLADPSLDRYARRYLLGYSLGGHVSLAYAAAQTDARVRSVATVCAPLDLEAGAIEIDRPKGRVYRTHVLAGLKEIYREVAQRRPGPVSVSEADRISTIREWDEKVIAPRFGFSSAEDYWRTQSVAGRLRHIALPTLAVVARRDPMVFVHTIEPHIGEAGANIRWVILDEGGHVGFPTNVRLGFGSSGNLHTQVVDWLRSPR